MYRLLVALVRLAVRSRRSKDLEIIVLRHQLGVLRRQVDRPELTDADRSLLAAIAAALPRPSRAGWLVTPTHCCAGTAAASPDTGPNHSDRRADHRRQRSFADSHCASQPRIRPGATAASTANSPGSATALLRPRLADPKERRNRPRTHRVARNAKCSDVKHCRACCSTGCCPMIGRSSTGAARLSLVAACHA